MSAEENQPNPGSQAENAPASNVPPRLPLLLDVSLSISQVATILLGCAVALISLLSNANLLMVAVRSGAAMLSVGLLMWLLNWYLSRNSLETARQELLSELEKESEDSGESTIEKQA